MSDADIQVIGAVLSVVLFKVGVLLENYISERLPANVKAQTQGIASAAVDKVQNLYQGKSGVEKKAIAEGLVADGLKALRLPVNASLIDIFIEEAVSLLPPSTPSAEPATPAPSV